MLGFFRWRPTSFRRFRRVGWASGYGARRVLAAGLFALTLLVACVPPLAVSPLIGMILALGGTAWGFVTVNAYPLVVQMGHHGAIGTSTGLYYLATSLAASAGPPLAGSTMDLFGNSVALRIQLGRFRLRALLHQPLKPPRAGTGDDGLWLEPPSHWYHWACRVKKPAYSPRVRRSCS